MSTKPGVAWACVLSALAQVGCREPAAESEAIRSVRAIKVGDVKAVAGAEFPGRAKAKDEVDLSFQVAGPLISLTVDVGSKVTKGDVIAAIDPRDFQAALESTQGNLARAQANLLAMERGARPEELEQLKAALTEAEASNRQAVAEHERNASLLPKGAASQAEFDMSLARRDRTVAQIKKAQEDLKIGETGARQEDLEAKRAEIKALEAAVTNAQNQLDYAVLKAPFDGTVVARYVNNYQTVQAKQPIVRLLDVSTIEITIQVPESVISVVPLVKKAICRFDAFPDEQFVAQVTKIGSEASQTTRTYPVTVQLEQKEDSRILPGMSATVSAQPDEAGGETGQALIVPPGAVFTQVTTDEGRQSYVWVVDESSHKVASRKVETDQLTPAGLAVTQGLQPGEWVVTAGVNSLRESQEVTILQEGSR